MIHATAQAPRLSLRPVERPGGPVLPAPMREVAADTTPEPPAIEHQGLFNMLAAADVPPSVHVVIGSDSDLAVARSLRPEVRPEGLERRARAQFARSTPSRVTQPGQRGALCGDPGIIGETLAPINGRLTGCGIANPVRVREIDGVALSQPATINCEAARALQTWLNDGVREVVGRRGGGVDSLRVIASYSCRTRNSRPGARLSEHAEGNAIDVAAIGLVNGQEISVLDDWGHGREGRILADLHEEACGPFGTVLGPESDSYHQDHFHLDVASYRSGSYCR